MNSSVPGWPKPRKKFKPEPYSQGPHAHAVHDAGGKLIGVPLNRAKFDAMLKAHAPGCGSEIRIPGTNGGFARCGSTLGDAKTKVFCDHCRPGLKEALKPEVQRRIEVIDRRLEQLRAELDRLDSTGQSVHAVQREISQLAAERERLMSTSLSPERSAALFKALRGSVNENAERVVNSLLGTANADIVRVCANCERELGPLPTEPGQVKSHGICARHAEREYPGMFTPEEIAEMDRNGEFCPDMAEESRVGQ